MTQQRRERITIDKNICHGKPCIKGTRIMVTNILSLIAGGYDIQKVLAYYPDLTEEDVKAALEYTIETVEGEEVHLLQPIQ
ncbi:MAG TPA: DUF433 domain-containing protein [Bacteroidota bacterium]